MPKKTFIAHSSLDHEFVEQLAQRLIKDGIAVWFDDWEIKVGDSIIQKINDGLEESSFFIPVISQNSVNSDWVKRELNATLMKQLNKKDIRILPVLLDCEPSSLPPLLSDIYSARFSSGKIDDKEYYKLTLPIKEKKKADQLHQFQDIFFETVEHIDIILGKIKPSRLEIEFILKIIQEEQYNNYFFKNIKGINWFDILKIEGYFEPEKAPGPKLTDQKAYTILEWNVLPYLELVSQQINISGNEKYIDELLSIIKAISNYKDEHKQHIDNFRTWWYFVKILLNIPNKKIPLEIIDLIPIWLDSKFDTDLQGAEITTKLLPKFLPDCPTEDDIQKAEKIIEFITAIKTIPISKERKEPFGKKKEAKLLIDAYWLEEAFKKYSQIIGEVCTANVIKDLGKKIKIKSLLENKEDGTYRSFYEEGQFRIHEVLDLLTFILKRIFVAKAKKNERETLELLTTFLKDEYLYFVKMALYIIGQNLDKYSELFWEVLESNKGDLILEGPYFGDELKYLLQNLRNLSDEQKEILKNRIEEGPKKYIPKEDSNKYIAIWKQKRYQALSSDPYFKKLYDEKKETTGLDAELTPAIGRIESRWGSGPSPLIKEELLRMPNLEIAKYLTTFKTKDFFHGPNVEGLSTILKESVKEKSEKFIDDLSPFLNTGYFYVYDLIWGIRDAWNNKKSLEWGKMFDFIKKYINREDFWQDKLMVEDDHWNANHKWVVGIMGELIQDGTKDDSWAFDESHLPTAKEIIFLITDNLKREEEKDICDPVTYALNSPFGKSITALIYLALRTARLEDKGGEKKVVKWSEDLKRKYEKLLKDEVIEAYILFGEYMPNFYYLDKSWVEQKIKEFESIEKEQLWSSFMIGYLFLPKIYDNLYSLMKKHYFKALSHSFKERDAEERLIHNITIGYLRGIEDLSENSLFMKILNDMRPSQLEGVINFFWTQKDPIVTEKENGKFRIKIIKFWRLLYEKYKNKKSFNEDDKRILSDLTELTIFLPKIDEKNFRWLNLSASNIHRDPSSHFFIEYLDRLKDRADKVESGRYVGKIFLKLLDSFTPTYKSEHIISIVEYLYKLKQNETKDSADKICNIYGSRGVYFLRDIYKKNKRADN